MKLLFNLFFIFFTACSLSNKDDVFQAKKFVDVGVVKLRDGGLEEAQAAFELALSSAKIPEAFDGLGCVALLMGNFEQAQRFFLLAYEYDPKYAQSFEHLALLYDLVGDDEIAKSLYYEALELDPTLYRGHNNLAALLYDFNDKAESKKELLKASTIIKLNEIEGNINLVR